MGGNHLRCRHSPVYSPLPDDCGVNRRMADIRNDSLVKEDMTTAILDHNWLELEKAACDRTAIQGWTHAFYRYPARFSPSFARAAISMFSVPGDVVLDPYMGGGTTVVEAMLANRRAVGTDLNSLAVFVAKAKTSCLLHSDEQAVRDWAVDVVPTLRYDAPLAERLSSEKRIRNLHITRARFIKKILAVALERLDSLPNERTRGFVRCGLLQTAQWALDGKKRKTGVHEFRSRIYNNLISMLKGADQFRKDVSELEYARERKLMECNARELHLQPCLKVRKADLVVTSPPYPGVHMLYHRWQVDGRKETPAPYWLAGCNDGQGATYYNFGGRREAALSTYFSESFRTLQSLRSVVNPNAYVVQLIAFSDPHHHLPEYLLNMEKAGFVEVHRPETLGGPRIWRDVPNRKWHATAQGRTNSSREVVLVHRAV